MKIFVMPKIIRLTESQLRNVITRIIKEQEDNQVGYNQSQFQNKTWNNYDQTSDPSFYAKSPNKDESLPATTKYDAVMRLQDWLNTFQGATLAVDGKFGDKTKMAVARYQQKSNIRPTGVVDRQTADGLGITSVIGKFLPLYSINTFNQNTPPAKPSIDPSQQNRGQNEDPTTNVDNTPMKMSNYTPLQESKKSKPKEKPKEKPRVNPQKKK